jgi:hypothetical protein
MTDEQRAIKWHRPGRKPPSRDRSSRLCPRPSSLNSRERVLIQGLKIDRF